MASKRNELHFQRVIIESYRKAGGAGRKWATEMQVGMPDLVLTLPVLGLHLAEVKHRPDWSMGRTYANPLSPKQKLAAREFVGGGANVVGYVVTGSSQSLKSVLTLFPPLEPSVTVGAISCPYMLGQGFDVRGLVTAYVTR